MSDNLEKQIGGKDKIKEVGKVTETVWYIAGLVALLTQAGCVEIVHVQGSPGSIYNKMPSRRVSQSKKSEMDKLIDSRINRIKELDFLISQEQDYQNRELLLKERQGLVEELKNYYEIKEISGESINNGRGIEVGFRDNFVSNSYVKKLRKKGYSSSDIVQHLRRNKVSYIIKHGLKTKAKLGVLERVYDESMRDFNGYIEPGRETILTFDFGRTSKKFSFFLDRGVLSIVYLRTGEEKKFNVGKYGNDKRFIEFQGGKVGIYLNLNN